MTNFSITAEFANQAAALKSPWVINNGVDLKGPFAGREAARTAKADQDIGGKVEKFELSNYTIEAAPEVDDGSSVHGYSTHGLLNCPDCGVHLSNGVGEDGQEVNGKYIKHDTNQFCCLACEAEFGPSVKGTAKAKKEVAHVNVSTIQNPTKAVWHIADEMKAANPEARRRDVIAECIARGIANFTARTQYQQWFQVQKEMAEREAATAAAK